jgi:hypothetical protein
MTLPVQSSSGPVPFAVVCLPNRPAGPSAMQLNLSPVAALGSPPGNQVTIPIEALGNCRVLDAGTLHAEPAAAPVPAAPEALAYVIRPLTYASDAEGPPGLQQAVRAFLARTLNSLPNAPDPDTTLVVRGRYDPARASVTAGEMAQRMLLAAGDLGAAAFAGAPGLPVIHDAATNRPYVDWPTLNRDLEHLVTTGSDKPFATHSGLSRSGASPWAQMLIDPPLPPGWARVFALADERPDLALDPAGKLYMDQPLFVRASQLPGRQAHLSLDMQSWEPMSRGLPGEGVVIFDSLPMAAQFASQRPKAYSPERSAPGGYLFVLCAPFAQIQAAHEAGAAPSAIMPGALRVLGDGSFYPLPAIHPGADYWSAVAH